MGQKKAYELSGGIRVHEVEGDIVHVNSIFPEDEGWPEAFALLIKTKTEEGSDD